MEDAITIIITEDKELWRNVIRKELIPHNIITIAEAENGKELIKHLETLKPDVVLLDLAMPVMDGNETMLWLTKNRPDIKIIIMSLHHEPVLMEDYVLRGVKGCFSKEEAGGSIDELARAIRKVHKGGRYINFKTVEDEEKFTIRQKEITYLVGTGKSQKEIAAELGLSTSAVDKQKRKIMEILRVKTLSEFYATIFEKGLKFFRPPSKSNR